MTTFPFQRLPGGWPADAPQRSILSGASPYGLSSGATRESLGGFYSRLCNAHDIGRWTMTHRVLGPIAQKLLQVDTLRMARDVGRANYVARLSGITEVTEQWVEVLEYATLYSFLQVCTLLPIKGLVPNLKLLANNSRFCPDCYAEDVRKGRQQYERLIWLLAPVYACPVHGVRLEEQPSGNRGTRSKSTDTGFAPASPQRMTRGQAANGFDVDIARLIADLLDDAIVLSDIGHSESAQSEFLRHASNTLFDGKSAHFAAYLGIGKSLMHEWMHGGATMSLHRLALIAYCCGCAITDIVSGNKVVLSLKAPPSIERGGLLNRRSAAGRKTDAEMREELKRALRTGAATDGTRMAEALGTSPKYLRANFPEEYALIVTSGAERRRAETMKRTSYVVEEFCRAHDALVRAGRYPARRLVQQNMRGRTARSAGWREYQAAQREAHSRSGIPKARSRPTATAKNASKIRKKPGISPPRDSL